MKRKMFAKPVDSIPSKSCFSPHQQVDYEVEESYYRGYHSCKTNLDSRVVIRVEWREEKATSTKQDVIRREITFQVTYDGNRSYGSKKSSYSKVRGRMHIEVKKDVKGFAVYFNPDVDPTQLIVDSHNTRSFHGGRPTSPVLFQNKKNITKQTTSLSDETKDQEE